MKLQTVGGLLIALALIGCDDEPSAQDAEASPPERRRSAATRNVGAPGMAQKLRVEVPREPTGGNRT